MRGRSAQEIITKLRQAESFMAQGHTGIEVAQALGLMEALYQDRQSQGAAQQAAGTARIEELQSRMPGFERRSQTWWSTNAFSKNWQREIGSSDRSVHAPKRNRTPVRAATNRSELKI